jgi:hypothetical protein
MTHDTLIQPGELHSHISSIALTICDPALALVKRYIIVGKVRPALQDRFGVILDIEFVR